MRSRDLPQDRALPGRPDSPERPAGRARPPAELLDNLRLRLSQLADSHPSAPRDEAEAEGEGAGAGAEAAGRPTPADRDVAARTRPEARSRPELADGAWRRETREHDAAAAAEPAVADDQDNEKAPGPAAAGGGSPADAIRAAKEITGTFPGPAGDGLPGDISLPGRQGSADPYRPWFMSGEPWTPWWAGDEGS